MIRVSVYSWVISAERNFVTSCFGEPYENFSSRFYSYFYEDVSGSLVTKVLLRASLAQLFSVGAKIVCE